MATLGAKEMFKFFDVIYGGPSLHVHYLFQQNYRHKSGLDCHQKKFAKLFVCSLHYEIGFFIEPAFLSIIFQLTKDDANISFVCRQKNDQSKKNLFLKVKE